MEKNVEKPVKVELYNDSFQNFKRYNIPKAQIVIADIPYNLGANAYASSTEWYINGDNRQGESSKAGKAFFYTDHNFNIAEYFHFCNRLLKKEPAKSNGRGKSSEAPCMIIFCAFEQIQTVTKYAKKYGFLHVQHVTFVKNYSAQVLKANMRMVGASEHALILYRDKLPKFRNNGHMVFDWMEWKRDGKEIPKIHPTQKPVNLLKRLIEIYSDPGDVIIDPVAGSGSTLRAAAECGRNAYGFEIGKKFYQEAKEKMLGEDSQLRMFS